MCLFYVHSILRRWHYEIFNPGGQTRGRADVWAGEVQGDHWGTGADLCRDVRILKAGEIKTETWKPLSDLKHKRDILGDNSCTNICQIIVINIMNHWNRYIVNNLNALKFYSVYKCTKLMTIELSFLYSWLQTKNNK